LGQEVKKTKRIVSIQVCRGLAALLVVLAHLDNIETKYCSTHLMRLFQHGVMGVDLFFVISGIVISVVTVGKFGSVQNAFTFLHHRIARIYPIYWIYTTIVLAAFLYNPMWINAGSGHKVDILQSYLLIPTHVSFLVMQGWTLSYEVYFYLIFFLLMLLFPARAAGWVLAAWGVAIVSLNLWLGESHNPLVGLATDPLVLEFLAGCVIFQIYRRARLHRIAGILLISVAVLWITGVIVYNMHVHGGDVKLIENHPWLRSSLYGTFASFLLLGAMEMERSGFVRYFHFLEAIGDWSYSIYLSHLMVLELVGRIMFRFARNWHYSILLIDAVCIPTALLVGYLSYVFLEKPLMALLYKSSKPKLHQPA